MVGQTETGRPECFHSMYDCAPCVCLALSEVRRGRHAPELIVVNHQVGAGD